jgi:hypothetical protein
MVAGMTKKKSAAVEVPLTDKSLETLVTEIKHYHAQGKKASKEYVIVCYEAGRRLNELKRRFPRQYMKNLKETGIPSSTANNYRTLARHIDDGVLKLPSVVKIGLTAAYPDLFEEADRQRKRLNQRAPSKSVSSGSKAWPSGQKFPKPYDEECFVRIEWGVGDKQRKFAYVIEGGEDDRYFLLCMHFDNGAYKFDPTHERGGYGIGPSVHVYTNMDYGGEWTDEGLYTWKQIEYRLALFAGTDQVVDCNNTFDDMISMFNDITPALFCKFIFGFKPTTHELDDAAE